MSQQPFDRSSKWLIQHHGDALLKLGGVSDIRSWRAAQSEVVQPRQLPDGLLEVHLAPEAGADVGAAPGPPEAEPALFVVEIATYPERRLLDQVMRDATTVYLDRGRLPEVFTLILHPHPKWSFRVNGDYHLQGSRGRTRLQIVWQVVELWTVPAEQLLAANDVGLVPWVPLSRINGPPEPVLRECRRLIDEAAAPPEPVLRECRRLIDEAAAPPERDNLLAVTQVLARLRYNDPGIFTLFGGRRVMIESPLIQELVAESKQEAIVLFLENRFGSVPEDVRAAVQAAQDEPTLRELIVLAARCEDLAAFRAGLGPAKP